MRIKIVFEESEDFHDGQLIDIMMIEILNYTDDTIRRTPDYTLHGKKRRSLTMHNLSRHEADILYPELRKEIPGEIVKNVYLFKSPKTEKDPGPFDYSPPGYTEEAQEVMEEKAEAGALKGLDIRKFVGGVIESTIKIEIESWTESLMEQGFPPITARAGSRYIFFNSFLKGDPEDNEILEDEITKYVTSRPMYMDNGRIARKSRRSSRNASGNAGP